ncbi:hypothetical protein KSS87_014270 [Heliosperma pusillum]|nr:hypothetical protein KSS87_014270 [Heliosperma pusillum]
MEERRLNFNQPLLSVRRGSSMAAQPEVSRKKVHDSKVTVPPLPYYKSDLKSGPVRNPGVVPFQWEQMPGRPKYENKVPKDNIWPLAVAPKLPPGRISRATDIPSMAKGLVKPEGSAKDAKYENISNCVDDNETFVDAHDNLSQTESFFNCSVSGIDDPNKTDSGIFTDPQGREFMMASFLPSSKAVTSETPHFVSRKQSGTRKESKPVTRVIKWKQQASQDRFRCKVNGKEEDDREKEEEYVGMDDVSDKLCGLLHKFCVLNPVPGMRDNARAVSVVRSVRTRPEYAESCREIEKQDKTNSHRGNMKRVAHQHASKTEPLINEDFCGRIITPLEDGSHHLFLDKEKIIPGLLQECKQGISVQSAQQTTILANIDAEKTLYIDSEPIEHCRNSISGSSESRGRNPSVDSLPDMQSITFRDEKHILCSKSSDTIDSRVVSTREKIFQENEEDLQKHHNFNPDTAKEGVKERDFLALGQLLPKSPSESWLYRTLPSMPTKKPFYKLYIGNLAYKSSPMLRSSDVQHIVLQPARVCLLCSISLNAARVWTQTNTGKLAECRDRFRRHYHCARKIHEGICIDCAQMSNKASLGL